MTRAVELAQVASLGVSEAFKNRIINGNMAIAQRGTSAVTTDDSYPVDRFYVVGNTTTWSAVQSSTAPAGFNYSTAFTNGTGASPSAAQRTFIAQAIEGFNIADLGWGTADAKTVTVSFWVRSSLTGTFGGSVRNNAGDRSYPFSYTISAANTWEQKSVTITGDTTGTWEKTTTRGILLIFSLGSGSDYQGTANTWAAANYYFPTGATNLVATTGATFFLTGVQLEVGSSASSFEYRPYGTELQLCQRYYESGSSTLSCFADQFSNALWQDKFIVEKRSSGTLTYNDQNGNTGKIARWFTGSYSANVTPTALSTDNTKIFSGYIGSLSAGTLVKVAFNWFQNSEL
jgi:hypothetical protein